MSEVKVLVVAQMFNRINRYGTFAQFKVQLRRGNISRLTRKRNNLAALNLVTPFNFNLAGIPINRYPTIGVPDHNEITKALNLTASISDNACLGSLDRCALR